MSTTTVPISVLSQPLLLPPVHPEILELRRQAAELNRLSDERYRKRYQMRMKAGVLTGTLSAMILNGYFVGYGHWIHPLGDAIIGATVMASLVHWRLDHFWGVILFPACMLPWLLISHGFHSLGIPVVLVHLFHYRGHAGHVAGRKPLSRPLKVTAGGRPPHHFRSSTAPG